MRIADYGVIGGGRTAALVSRDGSIDWLCWPRFDSPAVLCRLLDRERGGFLRVGPAVAGQAERRYLPGTNVLETTHRADGGVVQVVDFLPRVRGEEGSRTHWVARRIEALAGNPLVEVRFRPSFDFGRQVAAVELVEGGAIARSAELDAILVSPARLAPTGRDELAGTFRLRAGETAWVLLSLGRAEATARPGVPAGRLEHALGETIAGWRDWIGRCSYTGAHADRVRRSALLLELLVHEPTGGIVAAPTTSLPEWPGGARNWDYRFTWLRDAALALRQLMQLGYHDEAMRFWTWLERLPPGPVQVLYRSDRSADTPETTLDHLAGFRDSRPVRVGNAAAAQRQLDVHGEVLDAAEFCERSMDVDHGAGFRDLALRLAEDTLARWRLPDRGIWEVRGEARHFVHSKLMCWVALDRAATLMGRLGEPAAARRYGAAAREVADAILERGWSPTRGAFTRGFDDPSLDAAVLELPISGFLPASDPRVRATVRAIREELGVGPFLHRYRTNDGLRGEEGAFLACSFWLAEALALDGRLEEAEEVFAGAAGAGNDLGLLSEQVDPASGELLGNFPQALSHLSLIRAALTLDRAGRRRPLGPHAAAASGTGGSSSAVRSSFRFQRK